MVIGVGTRLSLPSLVSSNRQDLKNFIVMQGASLRQDRTVLNYALFDAGY
ncbi:hypothetical protein NTGZN8_180077 [Candidatus Nitrotoga fabula]|uniref:Uncharacterized protein n=1 Tax=Candidatus Nitrotoga fabula TaxID=2182327 RepID=A0A916BC48_9PROT|nr:hypothetical protein NTGZN8_180077 [Candidatus Nitrotoga fabula]